MNLDKEYAMELASLYGIEYGLVDSDGMKYEEVDSVLGIDSESTWAKIDYNWNIENKENKFSKEFSIEENNKYENKLGVA